MNNWGSFLVRTGLIMAAIGLFMDTTVKTSYGEINNIGLMNKSQNYIILGGLLFIGGLLINSKNKNGPQQNQQPQQQNHSLQQQPFPQLDIKEPIKETEAIVEIKAPEIRAKIDYFDQFRFLEESRDRFLLRLIFGVICGVCSLGVSNMELLRWLAILIIPAFAMLTLRKMPSEVAIRKALLIATITSIVFTLPNVIYIVNTFLEESTPKGASFDDWFVAIFGIVTDFVFSYILLALYIAFRNLSKKGNTATSTE